MTLEPMQLPAKIVKEGRVIEPFTITITLRPGTIEAINEATRKIKEASHRLSARAMYPWESRDADVDL